MVKRVTFVASLLVVGLVIGACCFGGQGSFDVSGPTTALSPGFTPDPMLLNGTAGGPTAASTMSAQCNGYVGLIPSHTLSLSAPIAGLRIMAHAEEDTTLLVRLSDGTFLCNDDTDGRDPVVQGSFPAGNHNVYVGTYGPGSSPAYTLGITTNPSVIPSTMAAGGGIAPVLGGGGGMGGGAPGTIRTTGVATVALVTGNLPGVTAGSTCTYTQTTVDASQFGFDCRWRVECSGVVVYGDGTGGYAPCQDPSWPPGVLVADSETTSGDRDPSLIINPGGMSVRDDAAGPRGAYTITATLAGGGMPIPPG